MFFQGPPSICYTSIIQPFFPHSEDEMLIRRALTNDAEALTQLMHASEAYRGKYASILDGYRVSAEQIRTDEVFVCLEHGEIVGFYSLNSLDTIPELDLMFIADGCQGNGVGMQLFSHMKLRALELGVASIKIISHPPAEGFYKRMGAKNVGTKESSSKVTWERPILELQIFVQ